MSESNQSEGKQSYEIKQRFKNSFNISLGIFLFFLFFQPFNIQHFNNNNQLIFIAGASAIVFVSISIFYILVPRLFPRLFYAEVVHISAEIVSYSMLSVFAAVANVFYIHYVGQVDLSFYMVFKVTLICVAPIVIIKILQDRKYLKDQLAFLTRRNEQLIPKNDNQKQQDAIEVIYADGRSDKLEMKVSDLILVSSADNYINVIYKGRDKIEKKMIRNTLKSIEEQFKTYSDIIRCHRTCIVNINHIEKLAKNYRGYRLRIYDYPEEVPVSRQYLLKVKEVLNMA